MGATRLRLAFRSEADSRTVLRRVKAGLAALVAEHAHIRRCAFTALGGAGAHVLGGTIADCRVSDTGGGGLLVGRVQGPARPAVGVRVLDRYGV